MKIAMTIAGVDSSGGAGISADLKTFASLGVHGTSIVSSLTAQNTMGVTDIFDIPIEFIEKQFNAVIEDIKIDSVKTGMLSSPEIVKVVSKLLKKHKLSPVIDPVMSAEAGGKLLRDEAIGVLIDELIPISKVVTPNIKEAQRLSGIKIKDENDAKKSAKIIHELGAGAVIIKGGHLKGNDIFYDGEFTYIKGELLKGGTHGTGCTHSAAITAELAKGTPLIEAAIYSKKFVENAIIKSSKIGKGAYPVNQTGYLLSEYEKYSVLKNVEDAVSMIENTKNFSKLIPEVSCNIAMGLSDASFISDVAGVSGRIVKLNDTPYAVGCVSFGASSHIARIVLTTMKYDNSVKACVNIRYSEDIVSICEKLGFSISSFRREDEPKDVSTMEWGVSYAIEKSGKIPDVIYDKGGVGKEAMIRLLGKDAKDVARKAIQIASYVGEK